MTNELVASLATLPEPDQGASSHVADRAAHILRPTGALARLDAVAAWLAGWQRTDRPAVHRPMALVFAGDHGVAADGVSAYPQAVTASMMEAFDSGVSSVNAMARVVGAEVRAVDVGVGRPTGNIRFEPALDPVRFTETIRAGRSAVAEAHRDAADLLVIGEMGIGNTTAAAAVCAVLYGGEPSEWVGAGTGVDEDGRARKQTAVRDTCRRLGSRFAPLDVLREAGGAELAAIAGAIVEARHRSMPVVLDGYVVAAAAAALHAVRHDALDHCLAAHVSAEPGHRRVLARLGLEPLLDLGLRLGEASGAMAVVPLLAMAAALVTEVPTFDEWFGRPVEGEP